MSLVAKVIQAVIQRGTATIDDLCPLFPEATRKQIHNALENARNARKLRVLVRGNNMTGVASIWGRHVERQVCARTEPVIKAVLERGEVTMDELHEMFPRRTRDSIQKLLTRAKGEKVVRLIRPGLGGPGRRIPAIWGRPLTEEETRRVINSAWSLGTPVHLPASAWQGARLVEPLGSWSAE
jgi:hypothetical protein